VQQHNIFSLSYNTTVS